MAKNVIDNVEIVEPPIGELSKQHSSFKRTCLTGCGCVIFLFMLIAGGIKLFIGSGPSTIKTLPDNFPSSIPVYEKDNIDQITFIAGKYKNRSLEIAALFPKVILSPILLSLGHPTPNASSTNLVDSNKSLWKIITTPVGDARDTVQIEWRNMDAEPSFVEAYYKKELSKKNYTISDESIGNGQYQFNFNREDGLSGTFFSEGLEDQHPGTDYASLTINLPVTYQNPSK